MNTGAMRSEFTGVNFGVNFQFLSITKTYLEGCGIMLLHNGCTKVYGSNGMERVRQASEIWKTLDEFGADDARFTAECTVTVTGEDTALSLPAALTSVEEEAFAGNSAAAHIILGESVSEIGSRAFADMPALTAVEIVSGSAVIAEDAFDGSSPVIVCSEDSTACAYADAHGLKRLCR